MTWEQLIIKVNDIEFYKIDIQNVINPKTNISYTYFYLYLKDGDTLLRISFNNYTMYYGLSVYKENKNESIQDMFCKKLDNYDQMYQIIKSLTDKGE